jgi:hypothetical protein
MSEVCIESEDDIDSEADVDSDSEGGLAELWTTPLQYLVDYAIQS